MKLGELIQDLEQPELVGSPDVEIEHVEYDSRQVRPGTLFVAIKGYQRDGYDFADSAIAAGAVAVLGERPTFEAAPNHVCVSDARRALADVAARFYGYPGRRLKVCGVTGTNGKTTTCHMIKTILEARTKTTGLVSSTVYDTGKEVFTAERTTPESLDLQRLLYLMKKNHCVNAVVEVSSHSLELHRVDNINFRVAVYTNITRDHLDFHKTMENYLASKRKLLEKIDGPLSYAVINLDVPEFRPLFGDLRAAYISYSLEDANADVRCAGYEIRPDSTVFDLVTPMGARTVKLKLPGRFNLMNALAAASAGLACGVDLDSVIRGLEAVEQVPGRFNAILHGQPFGVYVDFAHTPDALERLCESAREVTKGRLLCLFGCGGDRDAGKRPLMGKAASEGADYCVVTSDNPRSEDPDKIIEDIKPGLQGDSYEIHCDRRAAIEAILKKAQPGDAVLLAGKGAEPYQEAGGVRTPFSDAEEAARVLSELGHRPENESDQGN